MINKLLPKFRVVLLVILLSLANFLVSPSSHANQSLNFTFVVDASGSMRGDKLDQVKKYLNQLINSTKTDGTYSLVTFANQSNIVINNSNSKAEFESALSSLKAAGNTALYDGIETGIKIAAPSKNSIVIVFSDGEDNASGTTLEDSKNRITQFPGTLILVGLGTSPELLQKLDQIAGTRGIVTFIEKMDELTEKLNALVLPAVTPQLQITDNKALAPTNEHLVAVLILIIAVICLVISGFFLAKNQSAKRNKMAILKAYDNKEREFKDISVFSRLMRQPIFSKYVKNEQRRLLAAGISIDIRDWLYIQIGVFILLIIIFQISGISLVTAMIFSALCGFGIGIVILNTIRSKKSAKFAEELPDVLNIIASSLQSGLSFTLALESVARESNGEVSLQMRRVLAEVQVGRNLIDSLQDVADRMDSQDFRWTISALTIQREIGGNLSDILTTTSEAIRGRGEIRNEIRALSAEGRMSAYVLIALPILMLLYLRLTRPESFTLMFSTGPGLVMMTIVGILMFIGWIWVKQVVRIKL